MSSTDATEVIDLTERTEPLSLSEISRALGMKSRGNAQKMHKPPTQAAMGGKGPANKPALHAVAEALDVDLGDDILETSTPRFPVEVVLALGKALGYLDHTGHIIPEIANKGRGRWLPVAPTIDPASGRRRVYTNHLATKMGIKNSSIEMALFREAFTKPDETDELGRVFWWVPTANRILTDKNITDLFAFPHEYPSASVEEAAETSVPPSE
ncbi:hypothetical protein ACWD3I_25500 [Streptomyces sp. NPDC002817]|uniref:hypothetical protein n=1 Tax=Streptomyces sp. NPDC088357 TaxID=3154655 RepID=UPI003419BED2